MISLVAAVGQNLELGKKGHVIWSFQEDLDFYLSQTRGKKLLVGKKTYDSMPTFPGKSTLYVLNEFDFDAAAQRTSDWGKEHTFVVTDLPKIIDQYKADDSGAGQSDELVVIGGAGVYAQTLPYATHLYLCEIKTSDPDADVFFPAFNPNDYQRTVLGQGTVADGEHKGLAFETVVYTRI
ncbi:dihydrofolate reductase [Candidatus Saccharibacteria bacterium]|nr:dihydrofolate reductase [Candidatus Saccharibacteria bacterium]